MSAPSSERLGALPVLKHLGAMLAVAVVMGVVVAGLAIPFAGLAGITSRNAADSISDLPEELETTELPQRTRILAADGTTLARLYEQNRLSVSLKDVAPIMRKSILAIEDYRFYQHGALDMKGTMRALISNQAAGGVVQGGSSITQQMVKLTLQNQARTEEERKAASEDTFARKLTELRYAIAFEKNYSKDWILERYLNIAYFGDGAYGIQTAARHYFSVDAKNLNARQSAMLAGLVKNPVGLDPTVYPYRALDRRNVVLDRMAELQVITEERARKLSDKPLGLKVTASSNGCVNSKAPFFCDYVVDYLMNDPELGDTRKERRDLLATGGLTIQTTLDLRFQRAADESVRNRVFPQDGAIGGLAMVEPRTGEVKALSQSRPMGANAKKGETYINYTVSKEDGGATGFQAGSTYKVFTLAAAIKKGISLGTTISSPPTKTFNLEDYKDCDGKPIGYGTFPISNSTSSGSKNLYTGTRESVNTFYLELEKMTGLCEPFKLAKKMGINLTNPYGDSQGYGAEKVATFTLGIPNTSPLELAEAYATFGGRGLHCDSRPVTKITDSRGEMVKKYKPSCQQVFPSYVADAVNDVLRGVQEGSGFGAANGLALDNPSAGKTGTTQSSQAVWFAGYTPKMAAAAMLAGVTPNGIPEALPGKSIGGSTLYSVSGSGTAGPMWGDAMQAIQQFLPNEDFTAPDANDIAGVLTPVPNVSGMSVDTATSTLENAGFTVTQGGSVYSSVSYGAVAYSSPGSGAYQSSGNVVTVYTSAGPAPAPKPQPKPKKPKPKKNNGGGRR